VIAVDTNVLVRILVDDPGQPAQVAAARRLASQAKRVFVPLVVQVELVWVLESGYRLDRDTVTGVLQWLEVNHAFALEDDALCRNALTLYRSSNADYADCVILARCRAGGLALHTFDKRLGRLDGAAMADDPRSSPARES
jgi:predicted nucleic-acid-binding protein